MTARGPWRWEENGRTYVAYATTRLTFRRGAWDQVGPTGLMIDIIRPANGPVVAVAMTQADVQRVFPNVLESRSWREKGLYAYAQFPARANQLVRSIDQLPACCRGWVGGALDEAESGVVPKRLRPRSRPRANLPETVTRAISVLEWSRAVADCVAVTPESPAYIESVKAWRDAWRPERICFLLVAESHVAELKGDTDVRVTVPGRPDLPSSYCRLVYCVGYGGGSLCEPSRDGGTPQFWQIFTSIAGCGIVRPPTSIEEKLRVLEVLRTRGVWLADASVTACYMPGGERRFGPSQVPYIVRDSWERFVWPEVEQDEPEQVWVIGQGVGKALRGHAAVREDRVIDQPQSRDRKRYLEGLGRMVESICAAERRGEHTC